MKNMKKKGFALIELLAVIVVLSVIALITVPMIMNVIEKARKEAFKDSVLGAMNGVEYYLVEHNLSEVPEEGIEVTELNLKNSSFQYGVFQKNEKNELTAVNISDGRYCAQGPVSQLEVYKGECDEESPEVSVEVNGKEVNIKLKDNVGVIGWTVTEDETTPTEWTNIKEIKETTVKWNATKSGIYYAWVKDKYGKINHKKFEIEEYIYGVKRKLDTSATTWERIEDAEGLQATAIKSQDDLTNGVRNDFDTIYPWSEIKTYNYNIETKEQIWIDDNNFSFDGSKGEVLTYIPEFYYKRYQDTEYEYVYISKDQVDEDYQKSEAFSIGRYMMSGNSSGVHSKSGQSPLVNTTITNFRTYARKLGDGFGQLDYHYFIIQLLYLVEYADYDSQKVLGQGNVSNTAAITSGGCNSLEMKSGTLVNDGKHSMIYRGMEDIYGNIWQFVDGINIQNNQAYVCYNPSQYQSDTFTGCYQPIGYTNANTNGYIKKLGYDLNNPLISFPTEMGGSASTYIPDNYWQVSGNRIALVGDRYGHDLQAGLWCWNFNNASSDFSSLNASRLIKNS